MPHYLAMRFFAINGSDRLADEIATCGGIDRDPCEFRTFEDGEHKGRPLVAVRGKRVVILSYLHGDQESSVNDRLVRLLFFIAACRENGAAHVSVLAPFLCYARKDRQTKPFDPVTTKSLAVLFEAVGTDQLATITVHNLSAFQNAFRCETLHLDTCEVLTGPIAAERDSRLAVVSPDPGGVKRAQLLRESLAETTGKDVGFGLMEKRRSAGVVSGALFAGDVEGRDVWIVDDMIVSGGTMIRAAEACRSAGASSVSLAATHALMDGEAAERLRDAPVERILVADTVPLADGVADTIGAKLNIVSSASLLAHAIDRLREGG